MLYLRSKIIVVKYRIKEVAKNKAMSLSSLANKVGISPNYLSRVIHGRTSPNSRLLGAIAQALEVHVIELFEAPEGFSHFYDPYTGEWYGIRKK